MRSLVVAIAAIAIASGAATAQRSTRVVSGTVRDSASTQPLTGALVQLSGGTDVRSVRSDDAGRFRFAGVRPGAYQLSVLRIGFTESRTPLRLNENDTTLVVSLLPTAQALAATRVQADISALYGTIAALPDLRPLAGAKIQVIGATKSSESDSTGHFFIPLEKGGTYMVRVVQPGFAEERYVVAVPDRRAVDASRLLDPSKKSPDPRLEHLIDDANQRLRARGYNSALVPSSELKDVGPGNLAQTLGRTKSVAIRGLKFSAGTCVFVNGTKTLMPLDAFDADEVEAVEVYALRGDMTTTLAWQLSGCSSRGGGARRSGPVANAPDVVRYVVVWLKK
jgi:hypothetical protein